MGIIWDAADRKVRPTMYAFHLQQLRVAESIVAFIRFGAWRPEGIYETTWRPKGLSNYL